MQDSGVPTAMDIQQPPVQAPVTLQALKQNAREPDSVVNLADRVPPDGELKSSPVSKFAGDRFSGRPLTAQELLDNLNVPPAGRDKIKVEKAWQLKGDELKVELKNGDTITLDRDADGYARISVPSDRPPDAATTIAMAAIAVGRGWKSVNVNSNREEFLALSFLAIENAGMKMNNPPPPSVIDKYRERFEIALATGVDPVAEERRRQAAELAAAKPGMDGKGGLKAPGGNDDKPGVPAAKKLDAEEPQNKPVSLARPQRLKAPRMG